MVTKVARLRFGIALERQFLVDQPHRVERRHAAGREGAVGGVLGEEAVAVEHRGLLGGEVLFHAGPSIWLGVTELSVEPKPGKGAAELFGSYCVVCPDAAS